MASNLLQWGKFKAHSGLDLDFKIDCDALTDADIECCANIIANNLSFSHVYGIPKGGIRLAKALQEFAYTSVDLPPSLLIVDDVLTTGASFKEAYNKFRDSYEVINCAVIFDRGELDLGLPVAVFPIFML